MILQFDIEESGGELRLAILVDGDAVWPHPGKGDEASDFDPEDVLSYLVDSWASLLINQVFPIPFPSNQTPRSLTGLPSAAEARWAQFGEADTETMREEQSRLETFLYRHDFSQMKFGAGLEEFLVLKSGSRMRIETFGRELIGVTFSEFFREIERLGDEAARLLGESHSLVRRWEERDIIDSSLATALISGVPLASVITHRDILAPMVAELGQRRVRDIANDNGNPIYAAARGAGGLGVSSLHAVTSMVRQRVGRDGQTLWPWRKLIHDHVRGTRSPTDQGIRAANLLRDKVRQPSTGMVDLATLSETLGLQVDRLNMPDGRLDGIAVMPGAHGPAILLNTNTRRQGAGPDDLERSLRFTWAHEIGHLLMDEPEEWPALVDVFEDQQRISRDVETRANAFAAYLLLPHHATLQLWEAAKRPYDWEGLETVLDKLTHTFALPRITAARQLGRAVPSTDRDRVRDALGCNIPNYEGRD